MYNDLVYKLNDSDFKKLCEESLNITEFSEKLGFKYRPGKSSRERIFKRINDLNISFKKETKIENIEIKKESKYNDTKDIGFVGEKFFEFQCALYNIPCFKDDSDNYPFDYIISINNSFKKIQVKTTEFLKNNKANFDIRHGNAYNKCRTTRPYLTEEIDFLFLFCIEANKRVDS